MCASACVHVFCAPAVLLSTDRQHHRERVFRSTPLTVARHRIRAPAAGHRLLVSPIRILCLAALAVGSDAFAPTFHARSLAPSAGLRRAAVRGVRGFKGYAGETKSAPSPSDRGATRPGTGFVDLLTKYAWGQQNPDVQLPYPIAPGTPPEAAPMVTQEHLDTLARDGVVHIKGVLSDEWIKYLRDVTDWQIANPHIWAVPGTFARSLAPPALPPSLLPRSSLGPPSSYNAHCLLSVRCRVGAL